MSCDRLQNNLFLKKITHLNQHSFLKRAWAFLKLLFFTEIYSIQDNGFENGFY